MGFLSGPKITPPPPPPPPPPEPDLGKAKALAEEEMRLAMGRRKGRSATVVAGALGEKKKQGQKPTLMG